ncbi:histidine kinase [Flavobacteriaceae bacterium]|nr:histidine kinase [Flavobacteriaceae bacterium]
MLFFLQKKNKEKESQLHKDEVAKLEAQALRIQMNPHFIYNALNSIQSVMILKGERESNLYIGMLSKLLRFTLEMNTYEKISLKEEIEYLEAYIGLQKMRMDPQFDLVTNTIPNGFASPATSAFGFSYDGFAGGGRILNTITQKIDNFFFIQGPNPSQEASFQSTFEGAPGIGTVNGRPVFGINPTSAGRGFTPKDNPLSVRCIQN